MEKIISLFFIVFLPGWSLVMAIIGVKKDVDIIEKIGLSAVLSITVVSAIVFYMNLSGIRITSNNIIIAVLFFSMICLLVYIMKFYGMNKKYEK